MKKHNGPRILKVATAVPPYRISQRQARSFAKKHFRKAFPDIDRFIKVFDHVQVQKRHFAVPLDWLAKPRSFPERNARYVEAACDLGRQAIEKCLKHDGSSNGGRIRHMLSVSSTGISTPTIDARIMNQVDIPKDVKRTPIWGLGCMGGVAGISRAYDLIRAEGEGSALLLAVEICSLTFQNGDLSKSNLIAASLFGDGAAAVMIGYPRSKEDHSAPVIIGTGSVLWPHSLDIMGWKVVDTGMEVIFSKAIPALVRSWLKETVENFLSSHGLEVRDVTHFISHPGGAKVLDALSETFNLSEEKLKYPRKVLNQYGNASSCSVLFVLKEILDHERPRPGEYGLIMALGPGFSSELVLIRWT